MLLVPQCLCGEGLWAMSMNVAQGYARIQMKAVGVANQELVSALEETRLRLRCKLCSKNYVVASQNGGCILCPCGTAMLQIEQTPDRGGYLWLEKEWGCKTCGFVEVVRFILEHGLASLWLEDSTTMTMQPMRLLSG